jgi:hypothetical protein
VLNALLVGKNGHGETFFQLESWPITRMWGMAGRHRDGYTVHSKTGWNLSTYGASKQTEKLGVGLDGRAVILEPMPAWEHAVKLRAAQVASDLHAQWNADPQAKPFKSLGQRVTEIARRTGTKALPDELDQAVDGVAQMSALEAAVALAHNRKATKRIFRTGATPVADSISPPGSDLNAAIVRDFQRLGRWRSRYERFAAAEMVSPEARDRLVVAIKPTVKAEADALDPKRRLTQFDLPEKLQEVLPEIVSHVLYKAASKRGTELLEAFTAQYKAAHPGAAPHEVAQAAEAHLATIDLAGETTKLVGEWSRRATDLPGEVRQLAKQIGLHTAHETALDLVGGVVTTRAHAAANAKAYGVFETAMQPSLKRMGEDTKAPIEARGRLSLQDRIADQVASDRRMRLRLARARVSARREVRKALRPQLQGFALDISKLAVEKAVSWVATQGASRPTRLTGSAARAEGRDLAGQALKRSAEFVRAAAQEIETQLLARTGQSQLTGEQETVLRAAEYIALQAVKANLTSGFTQTLRGVGRWAVEGNGVMVRAKSSEAINHLSHKVEGGFVHGTRITVSRNWKEPFSETRIQAAGVKRLTRKATLKAARWTARQPEVMTLAKGAAQKEIAANVAPVARQALQQGGSYELVASREARSEARTMHVGRLGQAAARNAFEASIGERLPEVVLQRAFVPRPDGRVRFAGVERMIFEAMEPFSHKVTYTKDTYAQLYAKLSPDRQKILPHPDSIGTDNVTLMMAEIPGGLEHIIADIHAHSMGYDRRKGNLFLALLNKSGSTSRILFGSIPQYCGGDSHYSTATPSKATMLKAYKLDSRVAKDWLRLYNKSGEPARAAKADLSITGMNFADIEVSATRRFLMRTRSRSGELAFRDPVAYMRRMMLKYPGLFNGVGEITGIKEMVFRQLGKWGWTAKSAKFQKFLSFVNETGQVVVLHNDFGDHGMSASYRPSPAKQNYENLGLLKFVFSQPKYQQVQIVFAHTGIGRLVRPNDKTSPTGRRYVIKDWQWDDKTGEGRVVGERTVDVSKDAPEHIHQLYQLFEAVPNARVDISWNDVTQAFVDLAQANPKAAESVVQFFLDHQNRIMFGSDTVKPVNEAHYNQALTTGSPLFAEIARQSPDAAFKILRGNYDDALRIAEVRVHRWTTEQLSTRRDFLLRDGRANSFAARRLSKKIDTMNARRDFLNPERARLGRQARQEFDAWVKQLNHNINNWAAQNGKAPEDWFAQVHAGPNAGVMPALYWAYPQSAPSPQNKTQIGTGTSGGGANDSAARRWGTAGTSTAAGVGLGTGVYFAAEHSGNVMTPSTGGGYTPPVAGSPVADVANAAAFLARSGAVLTRTMYTEKLRLAWETIFEQGSVTREGLDRYVSRLMNTAEHLGVTALQRVNIAAITEQFWANYTHLRDRPIDPASGWTEKQKFFALHAKVGEFMITVSREANLQESSLNALDARRTAGRWVRAGTLATYLVNDVIAWKWLESSGLDLKTFTDVFTDPSRTTTQAAAEASFRVLFALGNAALTTREGVALIGGLFKTTGTETNRFQKGLQRWGTLSLAGGGAAWTLGDALTFLHSVHAGDPDALAAARTLLEAAFTYGSVQNWKHENRRAHGNPMDGPRKLATPNVIVGGALAALMIMSISKDL